MVTVDLQAEFFVPLAHAQAAVCAVWATCRDWTFSSPWGFNGEPSKGLVDAMEFRQVKGDPGGWLSPTRSDSLSIHVSFNGDPSRRAEVLGKLPLLEEALEPFGVMAHWGKLSRRTTEPVRLETLFGQGLRRFRSLAEKHDPTGKFRNAYVGRMLFADGSVFGSSFGRSHLARL